MNQEQNTKHVGVVLVTHADYGSALLRAVDFIIGERVDCASISVDASLGVDESFDRLKDAVSRLDQGMGVIILTDMFGGTPTNMSLSLLGSHKVEVVTGVNLPMLIKVFSKRTMTLEELAHEAGDAGEKGIVVAADMLRKKKA